MFVALALVRAIATEPLTLLGRTWTGRGGKFGAAALSALGTAPGRLVIWRFSASIFRATPRCHRVDHFIPAVGMADATLARRGNFYAPSPGPLAARGLHLRLRLRVETMQIRAAFLNGEFSTPAGRRFFRWAFALKTSYR